MESALAHLALLLAEAHADRQTAAARIHDLEQIIESQAERITALEQADAGDSP